MLGRAVSRCAMRALVSSNSAAERGRAAPVAAVLSAHFTPAVVRVDGVSVSSAGTGGADNFVRASATPAPGADERFAAGAASLNGLALAAGASDGREDARPVLERETVTPAVDVRGAGAARPADGRSDLRGAAPVVVVVPGVNEARGAVELRGAADARVVVVFGAVEVRGAVERRGAVEVRGAAAGAIGAKELRGATDVRGAVTRGGIGPRVAIDDRGASDVRRAALAEAAVAETRDAPATGSCSPLTAVIDLVELVRVIPCVGLASVPRLAARSATRDEPERDNVAVDPDRERPEVDPDRTSPAVDPERAVVGRSRSSASDIRVEPLRGSPLLGAKVDKRRVETEDGIRRAVGVAAVSAETRSRSLASAHRSGEVGAGTELVFREIVAGALRRMVRGTSERLTTRCGVVVPRGMVAKERIEPAVGKRVEPSPAAVERRAVESDRGIPRLVSIRRIESERTTVRVESDRVIVLVESDLGRADGRPRASRKGSDSFSFAGCCKGAGRSDSGTSFSSVVSDSSLASSVDRSARVTACSAGAMKLSSVPLGRLGRVVRVINAARSRVMSASAKVGATGGAGAGREDIISDRGVRPFTAVTGVRAVRGAEGVRTVEGGVNWKLSESRSAS